MRTSHPAIRSCLLVSIATAIGACASSDRASSPSEPGTTEGIHAADLSRERAWIDEAKAAQESSDFVTARAKAAEATSALLSRPDFERDLAWAELMHSAARVAYRAEDVAAAHEAMEHVLAVRTRELPEEHPDLVKALSGLAVAKWKLGDFQGARALQERVLEIRERTLPEDHPDLANARVNLSVILAELGDFQATRDLEEKVLEVRSRTLPDDHPDLLLVRGNLALTLRELGDLRGARALAEKVLEVQTRALPEDHPDLAKARSNLAVMMRDLGDLEGARTLEEKVLDVLSRTLPEEHPELQWARANLAVTIRALGDLEGAKELQEKVLRIRTRTLPETHPDLAKAREDLAVTLWGLGEFQAARTLKEKVLEVRARTLPEGHPDVVEAREELAVTLWEIGDFQRSREMFEQVLESRKRALTEDHADLARTQGDLAATMWQLGDFQGARKLFESVLEIRRGTLPADHPDLLRVRGSLALTMRELGDLQGARELLESVHEVRLRTLPEDHPDLQSSRLELAVVLGKLGDLQGARALQEQVLEVRTRTLPEDHPDLQWARGNLAVTLKELGDFRSARILEERVLEVRSRTLPRDHPHLARARADLAATLRSLGDSEGARTLFESVLEVWAGILPEDHPDLQWARANLALTSKALGDLQGARALQERVLEVRTRTLPEDHPHLSNARAELAMTIVVESARASEAEGEELKESGRRRCTDLVHALAGSAARVAREATLSSSSREVEERCSRLSHSLSLSLSFAAGYGVFEPDPALARDAFVLSETTRASALAAARISSLARSDERYGPLREEIRSAGEELARLVQTGASRDAYDAVIARRDRAQREIVQLAGRSAGAADVWMEPDPAAISQRLSDGDAIVAYRRYTRWEVPSGETTERSTTSLCAFVLRKGTALRFVDLGALAPVSAAVRGWREAIGAAEGRGLGVPAAGADSAVEARHSARLAELILSPLRDGIGDAHRIVFVLDDVLNTVPVDALPMPEAQPSSDLTLLGDRLAIETRSTVQEAIQDAVARLGGGSLVALGGAEYSSVPHSRGSERAADAPVRDAAEEGAPAKAVSSLLRGGAWSEGFSPLPWTLAEARGIIELAAPGEAAQELVLLEGDEASRGSIEGLAPTTRFLHLATHGWFAPESVKSWSDPDAATTESFAPGLGKRMSAAERVKSSSPMLLCGLALAGANLPADAVGRYPGLVTAEEISGWDLSSCELAVLSACDTNVGERRAGQGVASLQKALHMAGARTVITSLWKVPDEATKELMLDFYRRIWIEKEPKGRALWGAKSKLRRAGHPTRDWAAWVLTGDPR